jgi:integrase
VAQRRRRGRGEGSIYQRSNGTWCAMLTAGLVDGRRVRKSVYGRTRQDVVAKLARMQQKRLEGRPVLDSSIRLDAYLDRWLTEVAGPRLRPSTYESYRDNIRLHINPQLGHIHLNKLAPGDIREFIAAKRQEISRRGTPLSPQTIRYMYGILRVALNDAMRDELISRNVVQLVRPPGPSESDYVPQFLDANQARAVLAVAAETRLEAMWRLAITGGLRQGELLALCWDDVNLDAGQLTVRRSLRRFVGSGLVDGEPKSKNSRRIMRIGPGMVDSLRRHHRLQAAERLAAGQRWTDSGRVFTSPIGSTLDPRNVSRDFKALCVEAGVPQMRFHSLRHTCATLLLAEGEPLEVIADRLGHGDTRVTSQVYAHIIDSLRQRAADRLDSMFV